MKTLFQILLLTWPLLFFTGALFMTYLDYRKLPRSITFKFYIDGKPEWEFFKFFAGLYAVIIFAIIMYYVCEFIKINFL